MSLTSPNCPAAQDLPIMVENAVASVPGVKESQGGGGVGSAVGPEPDVGRGPTRAQYVVRDGEKGLHSNPRAPTLGVK